MPTITIARDVEGFDLLTSAIFWDLVSLDPVTASTTELTLAGGGNSISFLGSGFSYQVVGGEIAGINGGTVTHITVSADGVQAVDWTGLSVSAAQFFLLVMNRNWTSLNNLLFGGDDTFLLTDSADQVRSFGGDDSVSGFGGNDWLSGGDGNDTLDGGAGGDGVLGGNGNDSLLGGTGNDEILGENGRDTLRGGAGGDVLNGGALADRLFGDAGRDVLTGGAGVDTLTGGGDLDVFVFTAASAAAHDVITDFAANDRLRLSGPAFNAVGYRGALDGDDLAFGTAAGDDSDRLIYDQATGSLWFDRDGSGSAAQVLIAELADGTALLASQIFIA